MDINDADFLGFCAELTDDLWILDHDESTTDVLTSISTDPSNVLTTPLEVTSIGQKLVTQGLTAFSAWTGYDNDSSDDEGDDEETAAAGVGKKRRRTKHNKPPNPDSQRIITATEEHFKLLNLDPDSKEGKSQRRRIRNRLSAQFHRERKKNYIAHMESLIKERDLKLQEIAAVIDALTNENETLKMQVTMGKSLTMGGRNDSVTNFSQVSSGFGSNTTHASLSDDVTDDSSMGLSTAPSSPSSAAFTGTSPGHHSPSPRTSFSRSSAAVRSGVSLLSVFFMLGITLFGQQGVKNSADTALEVKTASGSFFDTPLHMLHVPSQYTATVNHDHHHAHKNHDVEQSLAPSHGRVLLSQSSDQNKPFSTLPSTVKQQFNTESQAQHMKDSNFNTVAAGGGGVLSGTPMWKYESKVADLYPLKLNPLVGGLGRFQRFPSDDDVEFIEGRNVTNGNLSRTRRRYLRTRFDATNGTAVHPSLSDTPPSLVKESMSDVTASGGDGREEGKGLWPWSAPPLSSSQWVSKSWNTGFLSDRPATVASSLDTPSPVARSLDPSSSSSFSLSRVLLTSGRALLDPAMMMTTAEETSAGTSNVSVSGSSTDLIPSTWMPKVVSTWMNSNNNNDNHGSTIKLATTATSSSSGAAGSSSNMLVMLLPASSVRWGRVWGESAEGTIESMLHGLRVGNSTGAAGDANGENGGVKDDLEGMWVEIGCSIKRVQLVKNVTL